MLAALQIHDLRPRLAVNAAAASRGRRTGNVRSATLAWISYRERVPRWLGRGCIRR
ncbi:MAG: hypothetical protein H0X64_03440 [Gemmatimonadaceae bacterium]|nr:hypothetical protein [Gemmatimonadaceae bacterium]